MGDRSSGYPIPPILHGAIRGALAALWLYEGLYLKVLAVNPHELRIVSAAARPFHLSGSFLIHSIGVLESTIAILLGLNLFIRRLAVFQLVFLIGMNMAGIFLGGGEISDPISLMIHNLPTFACMVTLLVCVPARNISE